MEEEQTLEVKDYIDAFRRRRKSILSVVLVVFSASVIAALFWPPTYRSSATILIEEQEVPAELIQSTITSYATQRIQTISQRVMTRANLMEIIDKYDLYHGKRKFETTEEILERMRDDVKVDMINANVIDPRSGQPRPATIAFTLSFDGEGAGVTQKVASELTSLYLNENLRSRTEKTSETYNFLSSEADKLKAHIAELEKQLADFKGKNVGRLPEQTNLNITLRDSTERDLRDVESQMRSLDIQRFDMEGQLAQINPMASTIGIDGRQILDPETQLKNLRSEYISASSKYSPEHPDVVRLKRQIDVLEKQTGVVNSTSEQAKELAALRMELSAAREKYSADHPDVIRLTRMVAAQETAIEKRPAPETVAAKEKPDNPAYLMLQSRLDSVKSQYKVFISQRDRLRAKLGEYERNLREAPEVEKGYSALFRDLESSSKRYQEIKAKQGYAQAGQELEKESKGERFTLIDPPQLPEKPAKPNRPAIIILGFVLSLVSGLGYAAMAENMDSSVRGVRGVMAAIGSQPLSVIPYLKNSQDEVIEARSRTGLIAAVTGSLFLVLLLVHFFGTPLDVLWFKGMRKVDAVISE
jgi:uncharacterized protein involved in exopolysaccharide biosynthesis